MTGPRDIDGHTLKRYDPDWDEPRKMCEEPDGAYVLHSNAASLLTANRELRRVLKGMLDAVMNGSFSVPSDLDRATIEARRALAAQEA